MTVKTHKQAVTAAMARTSNVIGTCQLVVREYFGAVSAGDQDGDGDADAKDGWLLEPASKRHFDKNFPEGAPLYFEKDGGHGYGHRALGLADHKVRSTDMDGDHYHAGKTSTVSGVEAIERAMHVKYVGWSETIDGETIPAEPQPTPPKKTTPAKPKKTTPAKPKPKKPAPPKPVPGTTPQTKVEHSRELIQKALDRAKDRGDKERAAKLTQGLKDLPES